MSIVVIHQPKSIVGILRGEAIGVCVCNVERGEGDVGGGLRDHTEGCVLVVRGNAADRLVRDEVGNVLVAVVEVEEVVSSRDALHPERASGNRLSRIPSEGEVD